VSLIFGGSRERHKIGATGLPAGVNENADAYAVGAFQHSSGPLSVHAALSVAGATDRADFTTPDREHRSSGGAQLDSAYEIGGDHRLGAGLLLSTARWGATNRRAQRRTSLGLYAQDEWTFAPAFTLNAGARVDWLRGLRSGAELEPRASLVWQEPSGFSAHAGFARFSAAAPLNEERGTKLPLERDDVFDAGAQQKAGPWTVGIDGYRRSARNFIAEREIPGAATPAAFAFARARLSGLELSATYAKGLVAAWANVAISKSRARTIVAGQALFPSETLAASEVHWVPLASDRPVTASGGVTWRMGKISLSADMTAGSGTVRTLNSADPNGSRASAFATFGFAVVDHARLAGHALDLRADLTNITDIRYATSDAANLEGGWTRFGDGRAILIGIEQGF
jgi:outer membrane receptor protein involved in Fe transport